MITKEYLLEIFSYDPYSGCLYWKYREQQYFKNEASFKRWNTRYSGTCAGTERYDIKRDETRITITINGRKYLRSRLVYILHYGMIPDGMQVDHIYGDTTDDRIENLRLVSNQENSLNSKMFKNNTSGKTGVYFNNKNKKWWAEGRNHKGRITLYYGDDKHAAINARLIWEKNNPKLSSRHGKQQHYQITNIVKLKAAGLDDDDILYR